MAAKVVQLNVLLVHFLVETLRHLTRFLTFAPLVKPIMREHQILTALMACTFDCSWKSESLFCDSSKDAWSSPRPLLELVIPAKPRSFILLALREKTAACFDYDSSGSIRLSVESFDQLSSFAEYELVGYAHGSLGLISLPDGRISLRGRTVTDIEGHHIHRINKVMFYSLTRPDYDDMELYHEKEKGVGVSIVTNLVEDQVSASVTHPCTHLSKLLSSGSFFYSHTLDLTRSIQRRYQDGGDGAIFDTADFHFVWNHFLLKPVLEFRNDGLRTSQRHRFDDSRLFLIAMQGFVGAIDLNYGSMFSRVGIISRLSCKRTGTRYNARGIDDDGYVSNFVECQVPQKIELSRSPDAISAPFLKHMEEVRRRYGRVHIVNLLSKKEGSGEALLSEAFRINLAKSDEKKLRALYTAFDYHAVVKGGNHDKASSVLDLIAHSIDTFGHFSFMDGRVVSSQKGVLRTNCLDCLDRTNVIQWWLFSFPIVSRYILFKLFDLYYDPGLLEGEYFVNAYNGLWADNGDWLSRIYGTSFSSSSPNILSKFPKAGTGAIKSSQTRKGKQTVLGFLDDAAKSVNRFYINNFQDKSRQEAIDALLGKFKHQEVTLFVNTRKEEVQQNLESRAEEFRTTSQINVFLGTWNVNGKLPFGDSTQPWLTTAGIQELIELTAGQLVTADTDKLRTVWEAHFIRQISTTLTDSYVLIRSLHLVALGLFGFARSDCVANIRNIDTCVVKTGLGGMAGNKGGIGLSLRYGDTSCVFITAHLAAGEKTIEERNRDYATIYNSLVFKGRKIWDHDYVFWFGDFNYRIDLNNEEVRYRINSQDWEYLLQFDQLYGEKAKGLTFQDLKEGRVLFAPTYKYDNGTTIYDSSEKARVPSWTDRILYKGNGVKLIDYSRAECLMSDHRPVRAVFQLNIVQIDEQKREGLLQQIYKAKANTGDDFVETIRFEQSTTYKPPRPASGALLIDLSDIGSSFTGGSPFDLSNMPDAFSSEPMLPPAATQMKKWWDDSLDETWIPNEGSDVNPFYSF
ncbi:inositol polyphosphate 5-phosphatase [Dinochytrium kinnereticum]|nr:inositol polyphosphate 5-phosphatase [Dinochytrium kinnereticum]